MDQSKLDFLKQAASLLNIDKQVNYYIHGQNPKFVFEFKQAESLNLTIFNNNDYRSPLLSVIILLGQCQARFTIFPIFKNEHEFERLTIEVTDLTPVWDSSEKATEFKNV